MAYVSIKLFFKKLIVEKCMSYDPTLLVNKYDKKLDNFMSESVLQDGGHFIPQIPLEMSNGFARKKHFNDNLGRVGTQDMSKEQDGVRVVEERRCGNLGR